MDIDNKLLLEFSKQLVVLYVEDDLELSRTTSILLSNFFKQVDTAVDGKEGLDKYLEYEKKNSEPYDLIITDINMPNMNGIELSKNILSHNINQHIIIISAHDEASFLHDAINLGVNAYINKPVNTNQLKLVLYKSSQIVSDHKSVSSHYNKIETLNLELENKNKELEETVKKLQVQSNATNTKSIQVASLLVHCENNPVENEKIDEYFAKDEYEEDSVFFMDDDCAEFKDLFVDITESIDAYLTDNNYDIIDGLNKDITKVSSILLHYTPFLDPLAKSFDDLNEAIVNNKDDFINLIHMSSESVLMLFDAIAVDMERYVERFSVESMAMKNIHHIHEPTSLSIRQIITLFVEDENTEGDIEFF